MQGEPGNIGAVEATKQEIHRLDPHERRARHPGTMLVRAALGAEAREIDVEVHRRRVRDAQRVGVEKGGFQALRAEVQSEIQAASRKGRAEAAGAAGGGALCVMRCWLSEGELG